VSRAKRRATPELSTWGSVRRWESATRDHLRRRRWLWLHGWCIGLLVLAVMWGAAHLQMLAGSESLALRYLVTLGAGYLTFLLVLRWWAGQLVGEERAGPDGAPSGDGGRGQCEAAEAAPRFESAGGGDFGGGGAQASFDLPADVGSGVGEVAGGVLEVAGGADEGAVVIIPVLAVFLAGLLLLFGAGSLLLLYFGSEVLLAVAVELVFGYVTARTAVKVVREGWLSAAVRLTWKPLAGALACAVLLGGLLDWLVPQAHSLPHAITVLRQSR